MGHQSSDAWQPVIVQAHGIRKTGMYVSARFFAIISWYADCHEVGDPACVSHVQTCKR